MRPYILATDDISPCCFSHSALYPSDTKEENDPTSLKIQSGSSGSGTSSGSGGWAGDNRAVLQNMNGLKCRCYNSFITSTNTEKHKGTDTTPDIFLSNLRWAMGDCDSVYSRSKIIFWISVPEERLAPCMGVQCTHAYSSLRYGAKNEYIRVREHRQGGKLS